MHEMGIVEGILRTSLDVAREEKAVRINTISVSVGELTEVVETALEFAFDVLKEDTMAENATLVVTMIQPKSRCAQCGHEFQHDKWDMTCPECGGLLVETIEGRELRIDSIDVDTE